METTQIPNISQFNLNANESAIVARFCDKLKGGITTIQTACSKNGVTKVTTFQAHCGVDYNSMKSTREGRASGNLPAKPQSMNGCEWFFFPFLVKANKTGKLQLRFSNIHKATSVVYKQNGKEISAEMGMAIRKDKARSYEPPVKNIGVEKVFHIA
jgi:hypothetical protein